jgi:Icc-related predicted phosphoesterase
MRIGIVGDTHGDEKDITNVLNEMGSRKISHVFVVGDFGLWTHFADGHTFLDTVNQVAEANNLTVFAVGGNHENWDHWEWFCKNMPTHKGFAMVRRRVLLAPKVHEFTLANRQFVVAGGAVSIDKASRLEDERGYFDSWTGRRKGGTGPRTLWWPNEILSNEDMEKVKSMTFANPYVDVLLTHDCSNFTHFQGRLKPDAASQDHRHKIDDVIRHVKPKVHFHGHMHTRYEWENSLSHGDSAFRNEPWDGPLTMTYGLEANPNAQKYSGSGNTGDWWGILETDDLSFAFRGEGMQFRSLEK